MHAGRSDIRSSRELDDVTNVKRDSSAGDIQRGVISSADLLEPLVD